MKHLSYIMAAGLMLVPPAAHAQDPASAQVSGRVSVGLQQFDNSSGSSKFGEYRDIRDNLSLFTVTFGIDDQAGGRFLDLSGSNLVRADQTIRLAAGQYGAWRFGLRWFDTPHVFSTKARTPYIERAPGLLEVPATIPITFKKLATGAADAPSVVAMDALRAAYAVAYLKPTDLGLQYRHGQATFDYSGSDALGFNVTYDLRKRSGSRAGFGPIGDRPPRTLNVQIAEPVDHATRDLTLTLEHIGKSFDVQASYLYSDFANQVDTLVWQNIHTTAAPGADYDAWDRAVSVYGRRPLAPDNRYHNLQIRAGADLPAEGRLTATVAYGRMDQNQALLPYSYHTALANAALPRASADAAMTTLRFDADYTVSPSPGLNLRAFVRRYDLDNETPEAQWWYVTSDTSNLNGTVSYKNKRINLPYAFDRTNAGVDATYRFKPGRSALTIGFEREDIAREFREADTADSRLTASLRVRPTSWANARVRYLYGSRDGGAYNGTVTQQSYWYAPADAGTDNDNPQFTFSSHPDTRRYDVSDRKRHQLDATLNLVPGNVFTIAASVRYRSDDFASGVQSSQPLAGLTVADRAAATPGDQLGLLEDSRTRYTIDAFVVPNSRTTLNAFIAWDKGASFMRSMEFNENNKQNPSTIQNAELGPWTRAGSQWTADTDDVTTMFGAGATLTLPRREATLSLNYSVSLSAIDIAYGGFGVTNWDGTPFPDNHQFAFPANPPTITNDLHAFDARLEIPLVRDVALILGYLFERYELDDWQQSSGTTFFESVGSEYFLRDTSRSHQWGNRLPTLGTYLAPTYSAHVGYASFSYRF
ncbi:MAG: MtrB/PioB family outer membrane beta-barrel protein [Acidobacteriota bacterium]